MPLTEYQIDNGVLSARISTFGASTTDLRMAGFEHPLILGFPNVEDHARDNQYMGAVLGRYGNRIARGHVPWAGKDLSLEQNEPGVGHLHGGNQGLGACLWEIDKQSQTSVTLRHKSPDGHAGYPGNLQATAIYELDGTTLKLRLQAASDKDTIINMCHHPYFNFDGHTDINHHKLWIAADNYLPSTPDLIPTGEIAPVANTPFDYAKLSSLESHQYNNTLCLHSKQTGPLMHAATIQTDKMKMDLRTTQPGIHLYNGYKIQPKEIGHHGRKYQACAGLCLEAQAWPDSPNNTAFPSTKLRAGEVYDQLTEYQFTLI